MTQVRNSVQMDFMVEILKTADWLEHQINGILKKYNLSNAQYNILRILNGANPNPVSPGQIKERMIFQTSDVTRFIDRLVAKELVTRSTCVNNRRKVDISINENGIQLLASIWPDMNETLRNGYSDLIDSNSAINCIEILRNIRAQNKK